MAPQLKRRGVEIETEIEYRVGPFFVLAVNIKKIGWTKLIKITHRDWAKRKKQWRLQRDRMEQKRLGEASTHAIVNNTGVDAGEEKEKEVGVIKKAMQYMYRLSRLTKFEVIAQCLAWLYYVHWIISVPLCKIWYLMMPSTMRQYILSAVTDGEFQFPFLCMASLSRTGFCTQSVHFDSPLSLHAQTAFRDLFVCRRKRNGDGNQSGSG